MKTNRVREIHNYQRQHIGMLGIPADPRFPVTFRGFDRAGRTVCTGCTTSARHHGCLLAWAIMFYDDVLDIEFTIK